MKKTSEALILTTGPLQIPPSQGRPPGPVNRLPWVLAGVVAVAILGLFAGYRRQAAPQLQSAFPTIRTSEVRAGAIMQTIRLSGSTMAKNSAFLRTPYLRGRRSGGSSGDFGLVLEKLAAPGSLVKKNDPVAAFDRLSMLRRLDDYRAARAQSEFAVKTLRAEQAVERAKFERLIRQAKADMEKARLDLRTAPVRSAIQAALFRLDFDEAKATHEALVKQLQHLQTMEKSDLRVAQLALREAQVEERRAAANAARMVVRAPVEGLFVISEIFRGSELSPIRAGDQLRPGQLYAQIVDPRALIVEAKANQVDVERLHIGARAKVRFDAYPKLEVPARVYSVGPLAKNSRWRANYVSEVPVYLRLDRIDDRRLIPNLTVSADVVTRRGEVSKAIVPHGAVFHGASGADPVVYVQTADGWEKRPVKLGIFNHVDVAVRSGLKPREKVALTEPT